ncbi:HU family DNA-binding protein [Microbacterium sp. ASV81]|uniref:HU family DNA-binding protein n=1 Tax=Microbacterium capsulatum TaxID=3041921 RepID=A0ABU0XDP8_9MICO|nr:HU family DNA-binding protein [Microbacterium sp. ASV81]MDQ4213221.1 HU family DNA-binding protein [Microbacterium sp. ASV81]
MSAELERGRVSKREFVQRFARRGNLPLAVAQQAYDSMIEELLDLVGKGNRVTLTGFGKFYPQEHKGHRVRFGEGDGDGEIGDYTVLKFSATRAVNRSVQASDG